MERLIAILSRLRPDIDFSADGKLLGEGRLDSLDIVTLVTDINCEFGISIPIDRINEESFDSIGSVWALIRECGAEV